MPGRRRGDLPSTDPGQIGDLSNALLAYHAASAPQNSSGAARRPLRRAPSGVMPGMLAARIARPHHLAVPAQFLEADLGGVIRPAGPALEGLEMVAQVRGFRLLLFQVLDA